MNTVKKLSSFVAIATLLTACGGEVKNAEVNPTPHDMKSGEGLFSGKSGNMLDAFKSKDSDSVAGTGGMAVNKYLWQASIDAVNFMPLAQTDSNGGVIITDWYSRPEATNERVKVNVFIFGKSLRPSALKVKLFKQKQQNGAWVEVSADDAAARQLEDLILTNARVARVKALASE